MRMHSTSIAPTVNGLRPDQPVHATGNTTALSCPFRESTPPARTARTARTGRTALVALAALFFLAALFTRSGAQAASHERLDVHSAILMDMSTGRILYEQNADEPIPPASLTKVLSMYVALDKVRSGKASLKDEVKVSRRAFGTGGSRMFLKQGETVSLDDLLEGMAVSSGNDASVATAEHIGGNVDGFVQMMNTKARALGMKNSVFRNPHGLPAAGQHTTARDMLLLSRAYLAQYPEALRYHSTRFIKHNKVITTNKNPLLGNCEGADGLKTGWVYASGYNLISTAKRGKTRLLAVVLGAQTTQTRAQEVNRLVEAGFGSVAGGGKSVPALLADMKPADYALNLNKTNSAAYAEMRKSAKESRVSKSRKAALTAKARGEATEPQSKRGSSKRQKATVKTAASKSATAKAVPAKSVASKTKVADRKTGAASAEQEPAPKARKRATTNSKSTADKTPQQQGKKS